jgi:hypothetical protein
LGCPSPQPSTGTVPTLCTSMACRRVSGPPWRRLQTSTGRPRLRFVTLPRGSGTAATLCPPAPPPGPATLWAEPCSRQVLSRVGGVGVLAAPRRGVVTVHRCCMSCLEGLRTHVALLSSCMCGVCLNASGGSILQTDKVPSDWLDNLRRIDEVWVPTRSASVWCSDCCLLLWLLLAAACCLLLRAAARCCLLLLAACCCRCVLLAAVAAATASGGAIISC